MQKREFIGLVAEKTGMSKRDNERVMDAIFQTLGQLLVEGDRLVVSGFGTFTTKQRAARIARNPGTGQAIPLPAGRTAVLKPAQVYKERLAGAVPSRPRRMSQREKRITL